MRFPKNRANVYMVCRSVEGRDDMVIGVFESLTEADAFKGTCEQDFLDRGFTPDDFSFYVEMTTFYSG